MSTGGYANAENVDGNIYLVMSLRNFGSGIGVRQGWGVRAGLQRRSVEHVPEDDLRPQSRDLYIPPGDLGVWQGAIPRDDADETNRLISTARHWYLDHAGQR